MTIIKSDIKENTIGSKHYALVNEKGIKITLQALTKLLLSCYADEICIHPIIIGDNDLINICTNIDIGKRLGVYVECIYDTENQIAFDISSELIDLFINSKLLLQDEQKNTLDEKIDEMAARHEDLIVSQDYDFFGHRSNLD